MNGFVGWHDRTLHSCERLPTGCPEYIPEATAVRLVRGKYIHNKGTNSSSSSSSSTNKSPHMSQWAWRHLHVVNETRIARSSSGLRRSQIASNILMVNGEGLKIANLRPMPIDALLTVETPFFVDAFNHVPMHTENISQI